MKSLLIALSFVFTMNAFAQETINPKDACRYWGKTITIKGIVKDYKAWERFNVIHTLAINKSFPNQELSIRVGGEDFLYDATKLKDMGEIEFTGRIVLENDGCMMIVDSMKQIVLSPKQMRKVTSKPKKHNQRKLQQMVDKANRLQKEINN